MVSRRNYQLPLLFLEIQELWEKSSWFMQNGLKSNEWRRIWVEETFKIEVHKEGPNTSELLQNWLTPEIRSLVFNLCKFENPERSTAESYKMHWNLINVAEFGSKKLLISKYRRGDQIIQRISKIGSLQKLDPPCLISTNFKTLKKVLLNCAEYIEI